MSDGPLQSLINGQQAQVISVRDRGFQYGDGCFETIRVIKQKLILWPDHLKRLKHACDVLRLATDFDLLQHEITQMVASSELSSAIVKVIISRGAGGRGYAPVSAATCTRVLQLFDYVELDKRSGARLTVCDYRLSTNAALAGIKHLNRLDQVLASAQIPLGFDEGLCMDQSGYLIEGCRSNLVLLMGDELITPDLSSCGVEGVMLNYLAREFAREGNPVTRMKIKPEHLHEASEMFLCNSVFGVWPVAEIRYSGAELFWPVSERPYCERALQISNQLTQARD
ncbi:MAG: aminodeoxychorismate lyase [Pseudohongiellaceae bacterium]